MKVLRPLLILALLLSALAAAIWYVNTLGERHESRSDGSADPADVLTQASGLIERGAYLARLGNCAGCHTARGGQAYAGGVRIDTPFGALFAGNLTPDPDTGLGTWSADDFWLALHNGRSRSGRFLYPAFPYSNYTRVTRPDSDALFAYLRSLAPVRADTPPHQLRFPYDSQAALMLWRALYFRPGSFEPARDQSTQWNRGSYLVNGLGHCDACHAPRNALGATRSERGLSGGLIPVQQWYAPSLRSPHEAGLGDWTIEDIVQLLGTGKAPQASVSGPMASVVFRSMQYWSDEDLRATATYLQAIAQAGPVTPAQTSAPPASVPDPQRMARGADLYGQLCADCHGAEGGGTPTGIRLAGNRALLMPLAANPIQLVLHGGFEPATAGNPRPDGMPPFAHVLDNGEVAAVLTYVRNAWGNRAAPVAELDVIGFR